MSYAFDSRLGGQLYRLLPEVYRTRDKLADQAGTGKQDLARYLDAHGHLLDLIHATLEQQLKDTLPISSQDWLLPYFAQLLAASILSPDSKGKHAEISHAVSWRQRKGTLKCAEEIAEAIGQMEVEIQEGWKRVAMTPHIGMPVMSARVWDNTLKLDMTDPHQAIRHPGLPAAMIDLRRMSRAVRAEFTNPAARTSNFSGEKRSWRQANHHGVPCFHNSFDDVSRRTVDIRTPAADNGRYHHKRLLAYAPPPTGLFPHGPITKTWQQALQENFIEVKQESGVLIYSNRTDRVLLIHKTKEGDLNDRVELEAGKNYRIENIYFSGTLLLMEGQLELHRVEADKVEVATFSTVEPVLTANDCLFKNLSVGAGHAQLSSCTVLQEAHLCYIDAVDCIFIDMKGSAISGVIKYSRIPENASKNAPIDFDRMTIKNHKPDRGSESITDDTESDPVYDAPEFLTNQTELAAKAVLAPNTPRSIYAGASDRGEMGYYHHGRKGRPVHITDMPPLNLPDDGGYPLTDLIFERNVEVASGKLVLIRSAAPTLTVLTVLSYDHKGEVIPSLKATDCLFDKLTVAEGLARLEYCTVMVEAKCKHLQASDCIFAGSIINVAKPVTNKISPSFFNCIRYSNLPVGLVSVIEAKEKMNALWAVAKALRLIDQHDKLSPGSNTIAKPVFTDFDYCENGQRIERVPEFGDMDYGVLDQVTSDAIRFGAEDGGEMGAYHHRYYSLKAEAMLIKMREFLPVGIEPVLIQDTHLLHVPPISKESTGNGEGS
ncbi:MAG: hypothetical protein ACYSSN_00315 [Planctomycetota bacterium]|jgi:hypothetical protein